MVTGGFKVWHIIFIIIAFVVTTVVVYCCFHRCRIPRTKQEIEADLMRSNIANKFRDYLQELPNEPTTFVEALKKVQDIEEKLEADDAQMSRDLGAKKRMGWLKLRGKDKPGDQKADDDPTTGNENEQENPAEETADPVVEAGKEEPPASAVIQMEPETAADPAKPPEQAIKVVKVTKKATSKQSNKKEATPDGTKANGEEPTQRSSSPAHQEVNVNKATPKVRRKRDKPNLSRTKATHLRSQVESMEHNQLELPPPVSHQHHSKERHPKPSATTTATMEPTVTTSSSRPHKGKTKASKHSTGAMQSPPAPTSKHN